jgi:hypothetical protein
MRRVSFLVAVIALTAALAPASAGAAQPRWHYQPSPSVDGAFNFLTGASTVPGTRVVWAVGSVSPGVTTEQQPLALRWQNGSWSTTPMPDTNGGELGVVSSPSRGSAWAAGTISHGTLFPLVMHWRGGRWRQSEIVGQADPGVAAGITARADDDVWLVGSSNLFSGPCSPFNSAQQMIQHWDGRRWTTVDAPAVPGATASGLNGVAQIPGTADLVAVGGACVGGSLVPMVETYDPDSGWTPFTPGLPDSPNFLSVAAHSPTDIMVVGVWGGSDTDNSIYSAHFDGTGWTRCDVPEPADTESANLGSIAAVPGTAGAYVATGNRSTEDGNRSFVVGWDGSAWSIMPTPRHGPRDNITAGIAAASATDMTVVGWRTQPQWSATLTLRYHG